MFKAGSVRYYFYIREKNISEKGLLGALTKFYQKYGLILAEKLQKIAYKTAKDGEDWKEYFNTELVKIPKIRASILVMANKKPLSEEKLEEAERALFRRVSYLVEKYEYGEEKDSETKRKIEGIIRKLKRRFKNFKREISYKTKLVNVMTFTNIIIEAKLTAGGEIVENCSFTNADILGDDIKDRRIKVSFYKVTGG